MRSRSAGVPPNFFMFIGFFSLPTKGGFWKTGLCRHDLMKVCVEQMHSRFYVKEHWRRRSDEGTSLHRLHRFHFIASSSHNSLKTVVLENGGFGNLPNCDKNSENDEFVFYPVKQVFWSSEHRKWRKMTQMTYRRGIGVGVKGGHGKRCNSSQKPTQ